MPLTVPLTNSVAQTVVLIAGPSGSGKSTLLKDLKSGSLTGDIKSLFPQDAEKWPDIEANDLLKQIRKPGRHSASGNGTNSPCSIIHYDTHFLRHFGLTDYADDPASRLWSETKRLHIIDLAVDRQTVAQQFDRRHQNHRAGKSTASRTWEILVRKPLGYLATLVSGKPTVPTAKLYEDVRQFRQAGEPMAALCSPC